MAASAKANMAWHGAAKQNDRRHGVSGDKPHGGISVSEGVTASAKNIEIKRNQQISASIIGNGGMRQRHQQGVS